MTRLPPTCVYHLFRFLEPSEEFPAAMVCAEWHQLLMEKRTRRGDTMWTTDNCAVAGSMSRLRWAAKLGCAFYEQPVLSGAARWGAIDVCTYATKYLSKTVENLHVDDVAKALQFRQLGALNWLRTRGFKHTFCASELLACSYYDFELLEWVFTGMEISDIHMFAARHGYFQLMKHAAKKGIPINKFTFSCAAEGNHVHILNWILSNHPECAELGPTSVYQFFPDTKEWLEDHGFTYDTSTFVSPYTSEED